ncbi:MAG TPA: DNA-binding response regulator [Alphaproteobacteria bacterium]|nr:DNA-binding response regulator [Alphaproteobacteria bacterium]HNS43760.1 DNA-binding response regulator [Alphaproteobacteria bacterium]
MKILIVDRDDVTSHLIKSRLEPMGHTVEIHPDKSNLDEVIRLGWDIVFVDPSPMTTIQPMAMQIRRTSRNNLYMVLLSNTLGFEDAVTAGFNDAMSKPLDPSVVMDIVERADYMNNLLRHLSNDEVDFPSAGGVIAKSAYNQLFLSCIDRAGRYGETANTIFITFENYKDIAAKDGSYDAELIAAKLAQHLVRIRRQSDIIAQLRENEYALLLLRPMSETEPVEAANRFAESLSKCTDLPTTPYMDVDLKVTLLSLPQGKKVVEHKLTLRQ